jgi:serine/threonine protein kinase
MHTYLAEKSSWHADIKPDNILKVKERFKLADPGFACFALSEGQARLGNREQTTNIRGGTTTYGT